MSPGILRTFNLRRNVAIAAAVAIASATAPAEAQWLNYKPPGILRTADGKPDLTAAAPKMPDGKPDLSGNWRSDAAGFAETSRAQDTVKLQPWAVALTEQRKETLGRDSPSTLCLPPGPVVDMGVGKVVQTRDLLLMLWEGTLYREIFLDGRDLPVDPNPDWMGYSVGHWEGDTLVIVTAGFNDRTWLDDDGRPHTEALRVTERLHRTDYGHMQITRTFVDSGAFLEPWTVPVKLELDPDHQLLEYVCNENEKDRVHLVGKASDVKSVKVAPALLAKYAGAYEFKSPTTGKIENWIFRVDGDQLVLGGDFPSTRLKSLSETEFAAPGGSNFIFTKNDSGAVTSVSLQAVEGNFKAVRK
ncbi:MAG: hypothetical protein ACLPWG_24300 [Steroidobacteraceae bacterium]